MTTNSQHGHVALVTGGSRGIALREEDQGKARFSALWHALEDARVENWFIQRWPGSIKCFEANLLRSLGGRLLKRMPIEDQIELGLYHKGEGIHRLVIWGFRERVFT